MTTQKTNLRLKVKKTNNKSSKHNLHELKSIKKTNISTVHEHNTAQKTN